MKRFAAWIPAVILMLVLMMCAASSQAAGDLLKFDMELSSSRFTGPMTITVSITVTNVGDKDLPGPVKLYYPDAKEVEEFGSPKLAAGAAKNWIGSWTVTQKELEAGKISFIVRYSDYDENGELKTFAKSISRRIQYTADEPTYVPTPAPTQEPVQRTGYAVTIGDGIYVRSQPGSTSAIIDVLNANKAVYVAGQVYADYGAWHSVAYDGKQGYIRADMLRMMTAGEEAVYLEAMATGTPEIAATLAPYDPSELSCYGYVAAASVNFRSTPGLSPAGNRIGKLYQYALCIVLGSTEVDGELWYKISYNGTTGYVKGDYFRRMTVSEAEAFFVSPKYLEGINNNLTAVDTFTPVATGTPGDIVSAEDQQVSNWTNPENDYAVSYEPFDPFATPAPQPEATQDDSSGNPENLWSEMPWLPTQEPTPEPTPEPFTFRSVRWGDDKETVTGYEGEYLDSGLVAETVDGTYIRYTTKAVGLDATLDYYFSSKGLYSIRYIFSGYKTVDAARDAGGKLYEAYSKKYGPANYDEEWDSSQHQSEYRDNAWDAVILGYLKTRYTWFLADGTGIAMYLEWDKDPNEAKITITYLYPDYMPEAVDYSDEI